MKKRNPSTHRVPHVPHEIVADDPNVVAAKRTLDRGIEEFRKLKTEADRTHEAIAAAQNVNDPDLAEEAMKFESRLDALERAEAEAARRVNKANSVLIRTEGKAFADLEADLPAMIADHADGAERVDAAIDVLLDEIRAHSYRRQAVGYVVENVRRRNGDRLEPWSGSSPVPTKGGVDADTAKFFAGISETVRRFPYDGFVRKAVVGEGGYDRVHGLPVPVSELDTETVSRILTGVDPTYRKVRSWIAGETPTEPSPAPKSPKRTRKTGTEGDNDAAA